MAGKICSRESCFMHGKRQPLTSFYVVGGKPIAACKTCTKKRAADWQRNNEGRKKYITKYARERKLVDPDYAERVRAAGRKFDKTPAKKAAVRRYWASKVNDIEFLERRRELTKGRLKIYRNTPNSKERERKKVINDYATGKAQARQAVYWATRLGFMEKKTGVCIAKNAYGQICWGNTTWHHYNGYAKENWLDVAELCERHHRLADIELRDAEKKSKGETEIKE